MKESRHVANLVKHSNLLVNISSTITIEAALADTPVINVAYHPTEREFFASIVLESHWNKHFRLVKDSKATWIAEDEESLLEGIRRGFKNPSDQRQERKDLAQKICGTIDGRAFERLALLVERVMGGKDGS